MAETPVGYFPDVQVKYSPVVGRSFGETEINVSPFSFREQRRQRGLSTGQRLWRSETIPQDYSAARYVREFLEARRGQLQSFYFFAPDPQRYVDTSVGSVTAQSSVILPFKGGSYTDIRVASVTKAFTTRTLTPRPGTYAGLWFGKVTGQLVNAGTSSVLRATGFQTITAWVRLASSATSRAIVSNRSGATSGIFFYINSAGVPTFMTAGGGAAPSVTANFSIAQDVWEHVAMIRGTGGVVTFFRNGVQMNTSAAIADPVTATSAFSIGGEINNSANSMHGLLNDVRYYDVALSASEILNIYNGAATASANLRGHWRLIEGTGTTTADASGYGNTGTLTNSPTWVAGEDEITFTAGAQTGAVTGTTIARPRVIARSMRDIVQSSYVQNINDVMAVFPLEILELPS